METARRADQDRLGAKCLGHDSGFIPSLSWSARRAVSKKVFGFSDGLLVQKLDRYIYI